MERVRGASFAESEEAALALLNELGRSWLCAELQAVARQVRVPKTLT
jgi:hypothetical protein